MFLLGSVQMKVHQHVHVSVRPVNPAGPFSVSTWKSAVLLKVVQEVPGPAGGLQLRTWLLFRTPEAACRKDPWENLTWAGNHDDGAVASVEPSLDLLRGRF